MKTEDDPRHADWRSQFETMGEASVRMIDSGSQLVPDDRVRFSRVWLKEQEDSRRGNLEAKTLEIAERAAASSERATESAERAAVNSERANEIAAEALASSRRANNIAIIAAMFAAAATIKACS